MNKWNKAIMSIMTIVTLLVSMAGLFAMNPKFKMATRFLMDQEEFYFTGTTVSQQNDPAYYQKVDATHPAPDCSGNQVNCLIMAYPSSSDSSKPDLDASYTVVSHRSLL